MKRNALISGLIACGVTMSGCSVGYEGGAEDQVGSVESAVVTSSWGYAWAQQSTGTFVAEANYSRNSSGDVFGQGVANTITQLATGQYRVTFPGIGSPTGGNVQVTAYGSNSHRCKVQSWSNSGTTLNVLVRCSTAAGSPVNTQFSIAYVDKSGTSSADSAYLWADQASAAAYTPSATYQFNSSGANNTITRSGVGLYAATLPGQAAVHGTVAVTAYGSDASYCKVASWSSSGSGAVVNIRCFDTSGNPVDSRFTLNFANNTGPIAPLSYSYAWANDATAAAYTPSLSYQEGYIAGDIGEVVTDITAGRTLVGRYFMDLPGMSPTGSNVQVTSYGAGAEYCKVVNWLSTSSGTRASVACFAPSGAAANSRYVLVYTDDLAVFL